MIRILLILITITSVTACSTTPKPNASGKVDLVYKLEVLENQTRHGALNPYSIKLIGKLLDNPGRIEIDGVQNYQKWWCVNHPNAEKYAQSIYKGYCSEKNGNWDGKWCRSTDDQPIFYINNNDIKPFLGDSNIPPSCGSGRVYSVVAATSEDAPSQTVWLEQARNKYGYKTIDEINSNNAIKTSQQNKKINDAIQQQKINASTIISSGIGTKICSTQNNIKYIGYVEQIANNKIKITVSEAFVGNTRFSPGDFKPHIIWDTPENWYQCN